MDIYIKAAIGRFFGGNNVKNAEWIKHRMETIPQAFMQDFGPGGFGLTWGGGVFQSKNFERPDKFIYFNSEILNIKL